MNEEIERLQAIGEQNIHKLTHIPLRHVQALLHGNFEGFSKVQFLGFISILEREYDENFTELKNTGLSYFAQEAKEDPYGVFIVSPKKKRSKLLNYILIAFVFLLVLYFSIGKFSTSQPEEEYVDNTYIENIQQELIEESQEPLVVENNVSDRNETNATDETNTTENNISTQIQALTNEKSVQEQELIEKTFKIISKGNVWFGYINAKTHKHYQGKFKGEKVLDASKNWLLLFGHSHIKMYVNGELQKFTSRDGVRFYYKDNKLKAISLKEFKRLNRGKKW